jgi:hypothetical protein
MNSVSGWTNDAGRIWRCEQEKSAFASGIRVHRCDDYLLTAGRGVKELAICKRFSDGGVTWIREKGGERQEMAVKCVY